MFMVKSRKCHVNVITGHSVPDEVWIFGARHKVYEGEKGFIVKDEINAEAEVQYFSTDYYVEVDA